MIENLVKWFWHDTTCFPSRADHLPFLIYQLYSVPEPLSPEPLSPEPPLYLSPSVPEPLSLALGSARFFIFLPPSPPSQSAGSILQLNSLAIWDMKFTELVFVKVPRVLPRVLPRVVTSWHVFYWAVRVIKVGVQSSATSTAPLTCCSFRGFDNW